MGTKNKIGLAFAAIFGAIWLWLSEKIIGAIEDYALGWAGQRLTESGAVINWPESIDLILRHGPPLMLVVYAAYHLLPSALHKFGLFLPSDERTEVYQWIGQKVQWEKLQEQHDTKEKIEILERKNDAGLLPLEIESKNRQLTELRFIHTRLDDELDIPVSAGAAARLLFRILRDENDNPMLFEAASGAGDTDMYLANYLAKNSGVTMYAYHPTNDDLFYKLGTKDLRNTKLVSAGKGEFDLVSKSGALKYRQLHFKRNSMTQFINRVGRNE